MIKNKGIRIKLQGFDQYMVDRSTMSIIQTTKKTGARISGPIPLPRCNSRITLLRSPHIYKKSREQFEIITYKRLLDIIEPNDKTVNALSKLELAPGVEVTIKVL